MSWFAIGLIALSALLHALWNFFGKKTNPSTGFFTLSVSMTPVLLLPFVWHSTSNLTMLPTRFWELAVVSGICQSWYFASLAGAYRNGDISITYPLARSSPVIIVAITTLILGQGGVTFSGFLGMCVIIIGSLLLPMQHFADFRISNYLHRSTVFALSAAFATAGYSIVDDRAVKLMADHLLSVPHLEIAILYIWVQAVLTAVPMLILQLVHRPWRLALIQTCRTNYRMALIASIAIASTYILVLWSMQYVENVSYVVAFRQLSIPIGVALGIGLLKESSYPPKIAGVAMICGGLLAVALA